MLRTINQRCFLSFFAIFLRFSSSESLSSSHLPFFLGWVFSTTGAISLFVSFFSCTFSVLATESSSLSTYIMRAMADANGVTF